MATNYSYFAASENFPVSTRWKSSSIPISCNRWEFKWRCLLDFMNFSVNGYKFMGTGQPFRKLSTAHLWVLWDKVLTWFTEVNIAQGTYCAVVCLILNVKGCSHRSLCLHQFVILHYSAWLRVGQMPTCSEWYRLSCNVHTKLSNAEALHNHYHSAKTAAKGATPRRTIQNS